MICPACNHAITLPKARYRVARRISAEPELGAAIAAINEAVHRLHTDDRMIGTYAIPPQPQGPEAAAGAAARAPAFAFLYNDANTASRETATQTVPSAEPRPRVPCRSTASDSEVDLSHAERYQSSDR